MSTWKNTNTEIFYEEQPKLAENYLQVNEPVVHDKRLTKEVVFSGPF